MKQCLKLGESGCTAGASECCGSTSNEDNSRIGCAEGNCCLITGVKGCDDDTDCCDDSASCEDSMCKVTGLEVGHGCGIHGDPCETEEDCCGDEDQKYNCMIVTPIDTDITNTGTTCCIDDGLKGCGSDSHCCSGNCIDTTCVADGVESPGGGSDQCNHKGGDCTDDGGCCGSKLACENNVCCLKTGSKGCDHETNNQCCSGLCDTTSSTCIDEQPI